MPLSRIAGALAVLSLVACDRQAGGGATGPRPNGAANMARSGTADTAQANLVWADSVNVAAAGSTPSWAPAGIRGDGRDRFGQPSTVSEFQGSFCGVYAVLGVLGESSLNTDSDFGYKSSMAAACGSSRLNRFYFDGASTPNYSFGPHYWVMNLASLAVGQSMTQAIFLGVQQPNCQRLYYASVYSPSNDALITRLADVSTANGPMRQWLVVSQGSHRTMCVNVGNGGKLVNTGVSHYAPFALTITEVKPPYPVYP